MFTAYRSMRPMLLFALLSSIPAFYLVLTGNSAAYRIEGRILYGLVAFGMIIDLGIMTRLQGYRHLLHKSGADLLIAAGALASAWSSDTQWSAGEWALRLAFCAIVFVRIALLVGRWIAPTRLIQVFAIGILLFALAGAGFYWLEPTVTSYADGIWLAFTTGATVGFGDLVPSTPASRIFSVFTVLLGYALFSVVTASIAALFVGEDEQRVKRELHRDIRELHAEVAALRSELRRVQGRNADADAAGVLPQGECKP